MDILELKNISKKIGEKTIIADINLTLEENELLGIVGPIGSGKTTLLRIIAGLETPTTGKITIKQKTADDDATHTPPNQRGIGMVFQDNALWPHMSAEENIRFAHQGDEQHYQKLIKQLRLEDLTQRKPSSLSGGQRQCVAIARALAQKPSILLLDEPMTSLDWQFKQDMINQITRLKMEFGVSIIYVTHDQLEAFSLSDRIAVMNQGRIEQTGTPAETYHKPATDFVASFIRLSNIQETLEKITR
jgi:ABC-type sugar transport system ATPase subunit